MFMAFIDMSLLQTVLSQYVLWHIDNGVALWFPGDCLVHRTEALVASCRALSRVHHQLRVQVSHTLEGAGGLQARPGSFCTSAVLPEAQSEAGTEWECVWHRGFIISQLRIISSNVTGHLSFGCELSESFLK